MTIETVTLPVLRVTTEHSEYLIDQNAGTVQRKAVHEKATDFHGELEQPTPYTDILLDGPGSSLIVYYANGLHSRSTAVREIEVLP